MRVIKTMKTLTAKFNMNEFKWNGYFIGYFELGVLE